MNNTFLTWKKSIPDSKIIPPDNFFDKFKYAFWRFFTPLHPFFRDGLLALGLLKHSGRQDFLIGYLSPIYKVEDAVKILIKNGYGNHFIAWIDDDEILGMRYVCNFKTQYHIRFFRDGEIRGHYEYTPECHPILHMKDIGVENRMNEFLSLLGDYITPNKNLR
jgi:hypothetical protein